MNRALDSFLKSDQFKQRLQEADDYAAKTGLDLWATRIAWVGLAEGVSVARRFAQRRSNYLTSQAWDCYQRLLAQRVFNEDPDGVFYDPAPQWEDGDGPLVWFDTMVTIAAGAEPPADFPVGGPLPVVAEA